jgi:hypothetical protein
MATSRGASIAMRAVLAPVLMTSMSLIVTVIVTPAGV